MTAAIYARKSTDQTGVADDQKSVTRQVESARAFAARKNWTVDEVCIYVDDGISGAEFANRPGFLRLMNVLKPRAPFNVLIMSEVSRLGREQIETAYALKQLSVAGVRCFSYLEDRELLMESATDKFLLSAVNFAAEIEREKGRQRTYDAMERKARAGHVTGGRVFGYRNVEILGADGKRSHVARAVEPAEAEVIRQIFSLSSAGQGMRAIARRLNDEGAPSPRAQQGRPRSWAPSSVREVLFRPLYRGEVVWNQTQKRDTWGRTHQTGRPEHDWIRCEAPALRIVSAAEYDAAHARLTAARGIYLRANKGRAVGRPALGNPSKYLLTNLALCGCCGGPLKVRSRSHGNGRRNFYGCAWYHERGRTVCRNGANIPMEDGNDVVIEALLDEVLDPQMLTAAVDEALQLLQDAGPDNRAARIEAELAAVEAERSRLVTAIATGGALDGLLQGLQARETRRASLETERAALHVQAPLRASDAARVRGELMDLAGSWRQVLASDPQHARPIVTSLLIGRVTFTPTATKYKWTLRGNGTLRGLFSRAIFPRGMASPTGLETPWSRLFRAA